MNFDDYAKYIYQKHRLSLALAIINTKPSDLNIELYIEQLKTNMAEVTDFDDVTVCSDDFMTDADISINILRDFKDINEGRPNDCNIQTATVGPDETTHNTYYNSQSQSIFNNMSIDDKDITYYSQDTDQPAFAKQNSLKGLNNNRSVNTNNNHSNKEILKPNSYSNIDMLPEIESKKITTISKPPTQSDSDITTFNSESNAYDFSSKDMSLVKDSTYDSQKTIPYTLYGLTQNCSHYSQSQSQIFVPNKYLYYVINNTQNGDNIIDKRTKMANNSNTNILGQNNEIEGKTHPSYIPKDTNNESAQNLYKNIEDKVDQNRNKIDDSENPLTEQNISSNLENSQYLDLYFNEIDSFKLNNNFINTEIIPDDNLNSSQTQSSHRIDLPQNNNRLDNVDETTTNLDIDQNLNNKNVKNNGTNPTKTVLSQNSEHTKYSEKDNVRILSVGIDGMATSEIIPYKVLEELNKIKMYLSRKERRMSSDGFSTDSGYKSDSQQRSSNRSALQLSCIAINQSAHCLLNHILRCPLTTATRDITSEIAQTLAELIDRLHEEESYPPFLEELLDSVDILIRQVYKERNTSDCECLNKDEFIQRALLLSKSMHIQRHCIEKITNILGSFHEKITDVNVIYELTNIDEIENISYIFHILDVLLKMYMKEKDTLTQNSNQISQDDEQTLKRSSITDIWRKKWNPNSQEVSVGSRDNNYVLKNCSEILNRLIVDCINSYSLVAYSALKCFNTVQS